MTEIKFHIANSETINEIPFLMDDAVKSAYGLGRGPSFGGHGLSMNHMRDLP